MTMRQGNGLGQTGGANLLPVLSKQPDHPCFQCAKCCKYMSVEIDAPRTMRDYDHIIWYLYHDRVAVFVDWESDWFVLFQTPCEHLNAQGMCGVYEKRPAICKDFDWRECENHMTAEDGPADKWLFESADDFMAWLKKQRPKAHQRFMRFMRRRHESGEEPELKRISAKRVRARRNAPPAPA